MENLSMAAMALTEEKDKKITSVANELTTLLNQMLQTQHLEAVDVLGALARASASAIHQIQGYINKYAGGDIVVEEEYHDMLTAYLTALDMMDVGQEMDKMEKEKLN